MTSTQKHQQGSSKLAGRLLIDVSDLLMARKPTELLNSYAASVLTAVLLIYPTEILKDSWKHKADKHTPFPQLHSSYFKAALHHRSRLIAVSAQ